MVYVNYNVDATGFFQGEQFEREITENILVGNGVANYEKVDERGINELLIEKWEEPYNSVLLGSSRGLQVTREIMNTNSFYNCGMVGADFRDMLGMTYVMDREEKLPKNLILCLDPWILNGDTDYAWDYRSNDIWYREFLNTALGYDMEINTEADTDTESMAKEALFSPIYFQDNIKYYFRDTTGENKPVIVSENFYKQRTEVKMTDGSLLYTKDFRGQTIDQINKNANDMILNPLLRVYEYIDKDPELTKQFEGYIEYLQSKDVNIVFLLTPYHPICYSGALLEKDGLYQGFFKAEEYFISIADKYDIELYGSYNPEKTLTTEEDFYDGIHVKSQGIAKFFNGVLDFDKEAKEEIVSTTKGEEDNITIGSGDFLAQYEDGTKEPPLV